MPRERKDRIAAGLAQRQRVLGPALANALDEAIGEGVDLICFTGDLADWGLAKEYRKAKIVIEGILVRLGLDSKRFFSVPGNHDITRGKASDAWTSVRALAAKDRKTVSQWLMDGVVPPGMADTAIRDVRSRQANYLNGIRTGLGADCVGWRNGRPSPPGYRVQLSIDHLPFPVHVIGLDSAWLAGDDNDAGKLLLTRCQIDHWTREAGEPLDGFRICLMHHPLTDLKDSQASRELLLKTVDLVLHGHQHEPLVDNPSTGRFPIIAAGCLYEGDEGEDYVNGFHVIDVTLDGRGRPLHYEVEFWGWSTTRGYWFRTGAVYPHAPDGRLDWDVRQVDKIEIHIRWDFDFKRIRQVEHKLKKIRKLCGDADVVLVRTGPGSVRLELEAYRVTRERLEALAATGELSQALNAPVLFVGCADVLGRLEACLPLQVTGVAPTPCVVFGPAGSGKTTIVYRFYSSHKDQFPGGIRSVSLSNVSLRKVNAVIHQLHTMNNRELDPPSQQPCLIHIDDVDDETLAHLATGVVRELDGFSVIVSGRRAELGGLPGWIKIGTTPISSDVARWLLSRHLTERAVPIPLGHVEEMLANFVATYPRCVPAIVEILTKGETLDNIPSHLRLVWATAPDYAVEILSYIAMTTEPQKTREPDEARGNADEERRLWGQDLEAGLPKAAG